MRLRFRNFLQRFIERPVVAFIVSIGRAERCKLRLIVPLRRWFHLATRQGCLVPFNDRPPRFERFVIPGKCLSHLRQADLRPVTTKRLFWRAAPDRQ